MTTRRKRTPTDTERLDWFFSGHGKYGFTVDKDGCFWYSAEGNMTARQAIDASMKFGRRAERRAKEGGR